MRLKDTRINRLYSIRKAPLTMKYPLSALALAAACALPAAVSPRPRPTDVYVSVVDGKGDPATGLTAEDFRVREDGVAREVLKAGPATEPLTVAFLVDDSEATSPGDPDDSRGDGRLHQGARGQGGDRARDVRRASDDRRRLHDGSEKAARRGASASSRAPAPAATCWRRSSRSARACRSARPSGRSSPC